MHSILNITRRPDVTFYPNGRIDITSRIAKVLNLCEGDVIDIAVNGCEYQLYVKHKANSYVGSHEATVRPSKTGSRNFRCYSKRLTHVMMRTQGYGFNDVLRVPAGECQTFNNYGCMVSLITKINLQNM